jgi:hypothetical protein
MSVSKVSNAPSKKKGKESAGMGDEAGAAMLAGGG